MSKTGVESYVQNLSQLLFTKQSEIPMLADKRYVLMYDDQEIEFKNIQEQKTQKVSYFGHFASSKDMVDIHFRTWPQTQ